MSNDCPKCNSQNRSGATFCDACGASLKSSGSTDTPAAAAAESEGQRKTNFGALIIVVAIIAVIGWMLFGPNGTPTGTPATGAAASQAANPHGGTEATASGGGAGGGDDMAQMMEGLEVAKVKLDEDPLDTESLQTLYRTFGMIGRQEQVRPRLEAAVEALVAKSGEMEPAELSATLKEIGLAAYYGSDLEAVEYAVTTLMDIAPDNLGITVQLGNIYFDMERLDEAVAVYSTYLEKTDPATDGETYWNVRTDRATMYLKIANSTNDSAMTDKALSEFLEITNAKAGFFSAWFNLGLAYTAANDVANAEAAWETALPLAEDETSKYQIERELARLRGEDPPPVPAGMRQPQQPVAPTDGSMANPHGAGMDMGGMNTGSGMANPHGAGDTGETGDTGGTSSGMANPHGG